MKIITEQPDIVLHSQSHCDKLKVTIREKDVVFEAIVDNAGNQWFIGRKKLRELLND